MAIIITIDQKGARVDAIEKIIEEKIRAKYPDMDIRVERKDRPESRADRFREAQDLFERGLVEVETLRDELQEWYDNLPENFQQGDKGSELESAISELEIVIDTLGEVADIDVEFPSMY